MTQHLRIDFVSDIVCPWCVIGLKALEAALHRVGSKISAELHFQPFELNPHIAAAGEEIGEHLRKKYGASLEQAARSRQALEARGAELGFNFKLNKRERIYNTFDAHRLLHWAQLEGQQSALQHALFAAYFCDGKNPSDPDTLAAIAGAAGLDALRARQILASEQYAAEVRERERFYLEQGIDAVPAVIFNERQLISGGQPAEVFERALRRLASA